MLPACGHLPVGGGLSPQYCCGEITKVTGVREPNTLPRSAVLLEEEEEEFYRASARIAKFLHECFAHRSMLLEDVSGVPQH